MAAMAPCAGDDGDKFQVVRRRRRKIRENQMPTAGVKSLQNDTNDDIDVDKESMKRRIDQCRSEISATDLCRQLLGTIEKAVESLQTHRSADFFLENSSASNSQEGTDASASSNTDCHGSLHPELDMLVYGLGNFASCVIARYQLALLLVLRDHLQVDREQCHVYDPKFTHAEKEILGQLGCSVIDTNEEGKRRCEKPTLVFMPHCGKVLFNNLLWANWTHQNLQNLIIIGNSFSTMLDSLPERLWRSRLHYVATIHPCLTEEPILNTFTHADIFNDLSIHWFPVTSLQTVPHDVWLHAEEPVYSDDDLEIIVDSLRKL